MAWPSSRYKTAESGGAWGWDAMNGVQDWLLRPNGLVAEDFNVTALGESNFAYDVGPPPDDPYVDQNWPIATIDLGTPPAGVLELSAFARYWIVGQNPVVQLHVVIDRQTRIVYVGEPDGIRGRSTYSYGYVSCAVVVPGGVPVSARFYVPPYTIPRASQEIHYYYLSGRVHTF